MRTATTNSLSLPPEAYTLEASAEGFKTWSGTVTLGATQALVKDVVLKISSVDQQVEVQGQAAEIATESWGNRHGKQSAIGYAAFAHAEIYGGLNAGTGCHSYS